MKLIIQIPCFNEESVIGETLAALPRHVPGFSAVEWLIIDDGCTDNTVQCAIEAGADHVVHHTANEGLARAFSTGLETGLRLGADVIVNTDADNQYNADDIHLLTTPVLNNEAEMVIGARPIMAIRHFSLPKKILQGIGSWVVRLLSGTAISDAPSGFRAISKNAAKRLMVFSDYTYTLETIIQAGHKNLAIRSVPIRVNKDLRPSRLLKSVPSYIKNSAVTMIRVFAIYRPFHFFFTIGAALFLSGFIIALRYLWFFLQDEGSGHIQSLILSSILLGMGFQTVLVAFVADLLAANRRLLEDIRFRGSRDD